MANLLACEPVEIAATRNRKNGGYRSLSKRGDWRLLCHEPNAGSDVSGISTSARKDGKDYILNGTKCFISNGSVASKYVVLATLDKNLGHKGQTFFLVDRNWEGVSVGKHEKKMGNRAADTAEVIFENVRVPESFRLGAEGQGFKIAMQAFGGSRPVIAAMGVGIGEFALDTARDYARERVQFGSPIANLQGIQFHAGRYGHKD
jgi:alkylation response protein AidB-like acyl-CoA dehydrogenase